MHELERNFTDRKLGRGVIWARSTGDGCVLIDLEIDTAGSKPCQVELVAISECVVSLGVTGSDLLYRVSRIAISQVQQRSLDEAPDGSRLELNCLTKPWNGDLTEIPYGGATIGCATLT